MIFSHRKFNTRNLRIESKEKKKCSEGG
jgi:hypothetical protein